MTEDSIIVPAENRRVILAWEDRIITIPPEWRQIRVQKGGSYAARESLAYSR